MSLLGNLLFIIPGARHGPGTSRWTILGLLVVLAGCAPRHSTALYQSAGVQVPSPGTQPAMVPPMDKLTAESPTRMQQPVHLAPQPEPLAQPTPPAIGPRILPGIATRLLSLPAFIAAVILWPSELGNSSMGLGWRNTLNPMTLIPWDSQQEYDEFWRLPQEERERLIQASRSSLASSSTSPAPQAAADMSPRRHPNQTCDNSLLDFLQAEKDRVCGSIPGESCSPAKVSPKRLEVRRCSEIRQRIQAITNCLRIRQFIQDECFGGAPDPRHEQVLNELRNGLDHCLALQSRNCAPGHPMAEQ